MSNQSDIDRADSVSPAASHAPELVARTPAEVTALLAVRAVGLRAGKAKTLVLMWNGVKLSALEGVQIR